MFSERFKSGLLRSDDFRHATMRHGLIWYWGEGLFNYTLIFSLIFLAMNEVNKDLNPELSKSNWFILIISFCLGVIVSTVSCLNGGNNYD